MATAITIANTDYEIVEDVYDALGDAQVSSVNLFDSVTMAMSREQHNETRFQGDGPNATVLYESTVENSPSPEDQVGVFVRMTIIVSRRESVSGPDEKARLENLLKLINGAKNAVHAATITTATGWGDADYYHRQFEWGGPDLTEVAEGPWSSAEIDLEASYVIANATSH